ncbi:MAG: hypothetical protein DMF70_06755 [Acidobacteria bacterium]|nr:MAG: hypothetical protein DMF70_06755 [Acidobacteriota bacterium]
MKKKLIAVLGAAMLLLSLAAVSASQAQTTRVQTVQNPDGTYTIVEYPVGKTTVVTLNPVGLSGATGTATILRDPNLTTIKLNLNSLPADITAMNVYAVDPAGVTTLLGPIEVANGVGTFATTTPLSKFMLVASPDADLSAYAPTTHVYFRSAVPAGLTVIPVTNAVGEQIGAVAVPTTVPSEVTVVPTTDVVVPADYTVPMLGIPTFKRGDDTKLKVNFSGAMEGARANIFIEPRKHGNVTQVRMRFHQLKEAPKGQGYILWAVSSDNQFQRLGEIINVKGRNEAEIKSETSFNDFGLLLTTEDRSLTRGTIIRPSGHRVGVIEIIK